MRMQLPYLFFFILSCSTAKAIFMPIFVVVVVIALEVVRVEHNCLLSPLCFSDKFSHHVLFSKSGPKPEPEEVESE